MTQSKPEPKLHTHAFVLLSGGIDSATCLGIAVAKYGASNTHAVSIDYGQRHVRELKSAHDLCSHYAGVIHKIIPLGAQPGSRLTDPAKGDIPNVSYAQIKGVSPSYHYNRNMQMLAAIGAHVHAYIEEMGDSDVQQNRGLIMFGPHADDAAGWAYPDCSPEFVGAMAAATYISTYHKVRLEAPLQYMDKTQIIELGTKLKVPYELTWSCYKGEELHCGICPTCRARKEGFRLAKVTDPTKYQF